MKFHPLPKQYRNKHMRKLEREYKITQKEVIEAKKELKRLENSAPSFPEFLQKFLGDKYESDPTG